MLTQAQLRNRLIELCKEDVGQRETEGNNRSVLIDSINHEIGSYLGAPYCIAGLLIRGVKRLCEEFDLSNPVVMTPSTQEFFDGMEACQKHFGEPGDIGVFQHRDDPSIGHAFLVTGAPNAHAYLTLEYNTGDDGGRDGDGVYLKQRDVAGTKILKLRGFIDVIHAIAIANEDKVEQI